MTFRCELTDQITKYIINIKYYYLIKPHILMRWKLGSHNYFQCQYFVVKLREREGQRVDLGRSLKGHLWMVDGGWWYTFP